MSSSLMSSGKERLSVAGISPSTVTLYAPSDLALFDIPRRLIPEPIEIGALIEIKITRDVEAEDDRLNEMTPPFPTKEQNAIIYYFPPCIYGKKDQQNEKITLSEEMWENLSWCFLVGCEGLS
eukprot:GEMP01063129.1.p1 GENE.GEMP01063129.1~~GEMP01063129.1.p1  ORF type:complete len:123 (+),score=10.03 GEMP01063129.1:213-581(+)